MVYDFGCPLPLANRQQKIKLRAFSKEKKDGLSLRILMEIINWFTENC